MGIVAFRLSTIVRASGRISFRPTMVTVTHPQSPSLAYQASFQMGKIFRPCARKSLACRAEQGKETNQDKGGLGLGDVLGPIGLTLTKDAKVSTAACTTHRATG